MNTVLPTPSSDGEPALTEFLYMYRDAGNYKAHASVLLRGRLSQDQIDRATGAMEAGEFFVAEQVGIPPLYSTLFEINGGRTSADHAWHSLVGFREVPPEEETATQPIWGSTTQFIEVFEDVGDWDISLSPNYSS